MLHLPPQMEKICISLKEMPGFRVILIPLNPNVTIEHCRNPHQAYGRWLRFSLAKRLGWKSICPILAKPDYLVSPKTSVGPFRSGELVAESHTNKAQRRQRDADPLLLYLRTSAKVLQAVLVVGSSLVGWLWPRFSLSPRKKARANYVWKCWQENLFRVNFRVNSN